MKLHSILLFFIIKSSFSFANDERFKETPEHKINIAEVYKVYNDNKNQVNTNRELVRLYKNKNSRVKSELSFNSKFGKSKWA